MKEQNISFAGPDMFANASRAKASGKPHKAFNWDEAARIIKEEFSKHPDLVAEAGLQGDWNYTGGIIFENGKPTNNHYTYLCSNWAPPTLILYWDGEEQRELECSTIEKESRFTSDSKWDADSIKIIGIELSPEDED